MKPSKGSWNGEFRGFCICVGWISTTRFVLWVFICPTNIILFYGEHAGGYHAQGYHAPPLPPRAITPVYTSRLPHQSYHSPPIHVHRVITPAISNSYFVVFISPAFTPPLLLLYHHRAPHATTYSTYGAVHSDLTSSPTCDAQCDTRGAMPR